MSLSRLHATLPPWGHLMTTLPVRSDPTPASSGLTRWPQVTEDGAYLQIAATTAVRRDYSQTYDVAVQERVNATATTPAPTSSAAPATSTESGCQRRVDELSGERDTYRDVTIGLAVLAGVGALLLVVAVTMLSRSRRRIAISEKPRA